MNVTICGPNLRDQSKGTFHVHAAGCSDLAKYGVRGTIGGEEPWTIDAASKSEIVLECYADIIDEREDEDVSDLISDFHFAPCCNLLPETAPEPEPFAPDLAILDATLEPLHLVLADAHHGVLGRSSQEAANAEALINGIVARLERAKAAHLAGDRVAASREFDPGYEVQA